jgi:hypothetical protein
MSKYVVLVDVYSSGNFLPKYFLEAGYKLIHVQSTPALMPSMLGPDLTAFDLNLTISDGLDGLVHKLSEYAPVAVIAGQEPGVPLADQLSESLGLPSSNGTALSRARRDKYLMIERVKSQNLLTAKQFKSSEPPEILEWVKQNNVLPCVTKPLSSASTDGVSICKSLDDVTLGCAVVLDNPDIFGLMNKEILCQSYLQGTEYIVDSVSAQGQVYICGIWRYVKTLVAGGKNIYDRDVLIDPASDEAQALIAYIPKVLEALGIANGPAHSEVIITESGPALVEVGARLNGNMQPEFHDIAIGKNQAFLTYLAYCEPQQFASEFGGKIYRKLKEACVLNTNTDKEGIIDAIDEATVSSIERLASVFKLSVKFKPGKKIRPTIDLLSSPLRIFLVSEDQDQIENDYALIQTFKEGVYVVNV